MGYLTRVLTGISAGNTRIWPKVLCGLATFAMVAAFALGAPPAVAQDAVDDAHELQAEYDALFEQMFRDPADLEVTFRYAEVSALLGNFEAAVSAL